jgi:hypothetical protein
MAAVAAAVLVASAAQVAVAQQPAQKGELSDKSVAKLMDYAWAVVPAIFRTPTGKVIEIDKKKPDGVVVPVETARDVIRAATRSAHAQLCDMLELQADNYNALMAREISKKTWSDQQLLYISTLHRMTIHMVAGKVRVEEKGSDEVRVVLEPLEPSKATCPDERRKQVTETIAQYVASAPKLAAGSPQPPAGGAAAVQPAAATNKK